MLAWVQRRDAGPLRHPLGVVLLAICRKVLPSDARNPVPELLMAIASEGAIDQKGLLTDWLGAAGRGGPGSVRFAFEVGITASGHMPKFEPLQRKKKIKIARVF